jgi:hypothetical protein
VTPVHVKCRTECYRGELRCGWFDVFGVQRDIDQPAREPNLETWLPCNNRNSCDGYLPDPNML